MTILLSDPRVAAVPLEERDDPLVHLPPMFGQPRARVRAGLAARLRDAAAALPPGFGFRVVEGYRTAASQRAIIAAYTGEVLAAHPDATGAELAQLVSRFVAPVEVAGHVAGAAIDLTLVDADGGALELGTPIDATPEQSDGRCFTDAPALPPLVRHRRALLRTVLNDVGFVNYPTEWWHFSYGDKYWALLTGAPAALYGPVDEAAHPAPRPSSERAA